MTNTTMKQELEALRAEVERIKRKQIETDEQHSSDESAALPDSDILSPVDSILKEAPEMAKEVGDKLKSLIAEVEDEYDNLSPTIAVLIFALGTLFGRSLSSK